MEKKIYYANYNKHQASVFGDDPCDGFITRIISKDKI